MCGSGQLLGAHGMVSVLPAPPGGGYWSPGPPPAFWEDGPRHPGNKYPLPWARSAPGAPPKAPGGIFSGFPLKFAMVPSPGPVPGRAPGPYIRPRMGPGRPVPTRGWGCKLAPENGCQGGPVGPPGDSHFLELTCIPTRGRWDSSCQKSTPPGAPISGSSSRRCRRGPCTDTHTN